MITKPELNAVAEITNKGRLKLLNVSLLDFGTKLYAIPPDIQAIIDKLTKERDEAVLMHITDTGTESAVASLQGTIEQLAKERDAYSAEIDRLTAQLEAAKNALQKFIDSHEECTDFDGFTAQIVSMDDYHEAQESIDQAIDAAMEVDK